MPSTIDELPEYYAKDRATWRKWLEKHHAKATGVWLVYYKKGSGKTRVAYPDAVKEALCFGWIDTTSRPIDEERYKQLFVPRKAKSNWSKLNKSYVEQLVNEGLMTPAGMERVTIAKENGSWIKGDHVEEDVIPADLEKAMKKSKTASAYYEGLSKTNRFYLLHWMSTAKKEETRKARIAEIMEALKEKRMPDRYVRKPKK